MDTIQISKERETLTLGLYLQDQRASVSFVAMNRCVLDLGLQNIVYAIELVEPRDVAIWESAADTREG